MSPFMAIFAKQWVFQTGVVVHNMTWKGIETLPDFSLKLRIDQGQETSTYQGREHLLRKN